MSEERVLSDTVWTPERGLATPEVRGISWDNFLLSDDKYLGKWKTDAGIRVTPETALQSTVVLACCRILAETISGLPIHVYRRNEDGSDEVAKGMPLNKVLSFAPNEWQTKPEFFEQIMMNLTLWGNSFTRIRSGRYGSVSCLDNLHPSRMEVERLENGRLRYSYTDPETGRLEKYTQDQIMHIRWTPEQDGVKGMVPVEIAREAIGLARACEQHAARFWANSARPGVVLTTEGTLTAEAAERLRENWERLHRGSERAHRTAVLTGGMKAQEIGFTNESSQFAAIRAAQTEEIARVYRISLHLIQGTSGGDLETQGQEFVTYTLMPWLNRIESAISRSLIIDDDTYYAKFDVRGLLRANSQQRASYLSTMINLGVMTINEARKQEGLKSLGPMGDHHFVAMNTQTLEDATKPKPEAPAGGMPPAGGGGGGGEDGPPPLAPGGPPSMSEVKTGAAPIASPKGEASEPKMEDAIEESSADWEDAVEGRAFCPNGQGGGVTNTCGGGVAVASGDDDSSGGSIPAGDPSLVNYKPFASIGDTKNSEFATPPKEDDVKAALNVKQREKFGAQRDLPEGTPIDLRIDINAFKNHKVYAVTAHEHEGGTGVGKAIGYDTHIRLKGPVSFSSNENSAEAIGKGRSKGTHSTVKGAFDSSREIPADIDSWTPVGYDPYKATYYYDKRTGDEVVSGTDALSLGNTVFTRSPRYGNAKDPSKPPRNAKHDYRSLSAANQELYEAQEEIADENGKWPQSDAHYMEQNPFASRGMKCSNCMYFEGGQCEIVTGSVSPEGICKLWIIPEEKISSPEQRAFCATGEGGGIDNSCGSGITGSPRPVHDVLKLLEKIAQNPQGFTLDPANADQPETGIMVSEYANDSRRSVKIKASEITQDAGADAFVKWFDNNADLLLGDSTKFVGGWKTGDDFYIDVATRFEPSQASQALEAGRKAGQLAVFNLGTFKETWVKYDDGDSRKPKEWDSGFARARKDAAAGQVYDESSPAIQEEDWSNELTRHGHSTVRNYNYESEEAANHDRHSAIRHPFQTDSDRDVSSFSHVLGKVDRQEAQRRMVQGQPGAEAGVVQGSAASPSEARSVDCGRGPGGIFGPGNKCQDDGEGSPPADAFGQTIAAKARGGGVSSPDQSWKKSDGPVHLDSEAVKASPPCRSLAGVNSVTIIHGATLSRSLRETGVTLDQAARVCAALSDDADVTVSHGMLSDISRYAQDPTREQQPESSVTFVSHRQVAGIDHAVSAATTLTRTDDDELLLTYAAMVVSPEAQESASVAVAREVYKSVVNSVGEAKKIGVSEVMMLAAGDKDDDVMKGYRLWPRLGFDGTIPRKIVTPTYSARLGFFEPYGSKIPDSILSDNARAEKKAGKLTIQSLYDTKEGQRWWEENGSTMPMSLRLDDETSAGWQRFSRIRDRVASRGMDEILDLINVEWRNIREDVESRAFCATGDGNGVDNSCGSTTAAGVDNSWKKSEDFDYTYTPGEGDSPIAGGDVIRSLSIERPSEVASTMKELKVRNLTDVVAIGGGLTRGAFTSVSARGGEIHVMSEVPVDPEDDESASMGSTVTIASDGDGKRYVDYKTMAANSESGNANLEGQDAARMSSILLERFPESLAAAEKAGISYAKTFAMGDSESDFKGYRLWPQFGFDAEIYDDIRQNIPKDIIPHDDPVTIQELISTPDGDRWWNDNGESMEMTLNFKDKKSDGYKRYSRAIKLSKRLKKRNEDRDVWTHWEKCSRAFCPNGEGGGVTNSCGGGSSAVAQADVRIGDSHEEIDRRLDGMSLSMDQAVGIAGGNREGAGIFVRRDHESDSGDGIHIECETEVAGVPRGLFSTSVIRNAGTEASPEIVVEHKLIDVTSEVKNDPEKRHAAAREFFRSMVMSANAASDAGASKVVLNAAGSQKAASDGFFKGYTIWPRMGFDAPIPRRAYVSLPPELQHCRTLLDLHATPEGTRWWKENGEDVDVQLDLKNPGSPQMQVFNRFKKHFSKDSRSSSGGGFGDGWLSPEDIKKLDELWEEIWDKGLLSEIDHSKDDFSQIEKRAFCPNGEGNGIDNSCSSSGSPAAATAPAPAKPATVQVDSHDKAADDARAFGVDGVDGIVALGGGDVRGASVSVKTTGRGYAYVSTTWPVERDNSSAGQIHTTVSIKADGDDKELGFESFGPSGDAVQTKASQQKVISIISEKVVESIDTAEKAGFAKVTTFAVGDANSPYKGYRLWPQFGFDGDVPRDLAKKIPAEIVLKAKGVDIPPPGSTSIPHDLVVKSLASRHRNDLTIQELISTHDGDRWWDDNGDDVNLTLDLTNKASLGYQKWAGMRDRLPVLKKRNQTRSFFDAFAEERAFCATGEGNGVDNSCASNDSTSISAPLSWSPSSPHVDVFKEASTNNPTTWSADGKKILSTSIPGAVVTQGLGGKDEVDPVSVGRYLADKQTQERGRVINTSKELSDQSFEYMVTGIVSQVESAVARGVQPNFYSPEDRAKQLEEYARIHPLMRGGKTASGFCIGEVGPDGECKPSEGISPQAEFLFRAAQALTSPQANPLENMLRADSVLTRFFEERDPSKAKLGEGVSIAGASGKNVAKQLRRLNEIIDKIGLEETRRMFSEPPMRAGDFSKYFVEQIPGIKKGDLSQKDYLADESVPLFSVFGPKVGPFFANNTGDTESLTADVWFTRTWGRLSGELISETKKDLAQTHGDKLMGMTKNINRKEFSEIGVDGRQFRTAVSGMKKSGDVPQLVISWAEKRVKQYQKDGFPNVKNGDSTEKRYSLDRLAVNILDNVTNVLESPKNGTMRSNMIKVMKEASLRTKIPVAYMQDILWQDEQDAWGTLGSRTTTVPGQPSLYSDVIRKIANDPTYRQRRNEKRSLDWYAEPADYPFLSDQKGGVEQAMYESVLSGVDDETFATLVISLHRMVRQEQRSAVEVAKNAVVELRSAGTTTIVMPHSGRDGLHVMGFDAEIPPDLTEKLPESLSHCKTLLDLHVSDEGSSWWEQNGREIDVSIDLSGVQGRIFDGFAAGKPFSDIIEEGILDDYGNS